MDSCYQEAEDGIENNEKTAYNDTLKCEDTARNSIHNNLGFIDNLISVCIHELLYIINILQSIHHN